MLTDSALNYQDPIDAIVNAGMKNGQRTVFDIRESPPFPMKWYARVTFLG